MWQHKWLTGDYVNEVCEPCLLVSEKAERALFKFENSKRIRACAADATATCDCAENFRNFARLQERKFSNFFVSLFLLCAFSPP